MSGRNVHKAATSCFLLSSNEYSGHSACLLGLKRVWVKVLGLAREEKNERGLLD